MWYIYIYIYIYNGILLGHKKKCIGSLMKMWMDLESDIQGEVSQKEKNNCHILRYACGIYRNGTDEPSPRAGIETQM